MKRTATSQPPRPRTLIHPGRFNPVRIQSLRSNNARHVRLALQPGSSIFDSITKPLAELEINSASMTILGGYFECLQYCVAPPDPSGRAVIAYGPPIDAGRTYMIFGNATLGKSSNGMPLVHCHAAIRTESGEIKGGHVLTDKCIVSCNYISVLVTSLDGFELRQAYDPETNIPLLKPYKDDSHD